MKALVIGRHTDPIPGVEVMEYRAVTFPPTANECVPIVGALFNEAMALGYVLLLQNTPVQVAVAIARHGNSWGSFRLGGIVSQAGERLANETRTYSVEGYGFYAMKAAIAFVNPRAKVECRENKEEREQEVVVTCDPPMRFEFSHIEWF